jgi:transcription elongation GreA/GreB family factor
MTHLTQLGFDILKQKIAALKKDRMTLRSKRAAAYIHGGDGWHDNPEFQTIEVEERWLSVEIERLEQEFAIATVASKSNSKTVSIGSKVEIMLPDGSHKNIEIGDTYTANPTLGIISPESPLGKAVQGAKLNEQRKYNVRGEEIVIRIVSIT